MAIVRLAALSFVLAAPIEARAGDYIFSINNGTITITGYNGPGGDVVIPDAINGLPVASIGQNAFAWRTSLTSIVIPNSVTSVGDRAFQSCNLAKVVIPDSVITIGDEAFYCCRSLSSVAIPDSVISIGEGAFECCSSVTNVVIGHSVASIADIAFWGCTSLTNITISDSVTSIGYEAFGNCISLTKLVIPASVTKIWVNAFEGCANLTAITVDVLNNAFSSLNGVLFNKDQTLLITFPAGKAGGYTIPSFVTEIQLQAFYGCTNLTSVTIPDSVIGIGGGAFWGCTSLTNVAISDSVTNIESSAFRACTSLTAITVDVLNKAFSSLNGVLFNKDRTLLITFPEGKAGSYTIPSGVSCIGVNAFFFGTRLTSVTIPVTVTEIQLQAFYGCANLTSVAIPDSVTNLEGGVFYGCSSLTNVVIGSSVPSIGSFAFYGCNSLTTIVIPDSVTNVGYGAFWANLTGIYFEGDAPGLAASTGGAFSSGVLYYLPGSIGWSPIFDSLPTALWVRPNPVILRGSVAAPTNGFGFTISWATNVSVVVEGCTDLANADWLPLATNRLANGTAYFRDPEWTNYPSRSYRVRSP